MALASVTSPGAIRGEEARDAEHRIRPKRERIEEVVVDAAVDHVHALRPVRRAHVDECRSARRDPGPRPARRPSAAPGTRARNTRELCAPGVSTATVGRSSPAGEQAVEIGEQQVGIVLDRADALRREELREEPHHHLAVLEHVGHARRDAQVVLEDVELARARADEIDAGDVRVDAAGNVDSLHLGAILRVRQHALGRHDAGLRGSPDRDRCRAGTH